MKHDQRAVERAALLADAASLRRAASIMWWRGWSPDYKHPWRVCLLQALARAHGHSPMKWLDEEPPQALIELAQERCRRFGAYGPENIRSVTYYNDRVCRNKREAIGMLKAAAALAEERANA